MALLKIARMGHKALRQVAEPLAQPDAEIRRIAADMVETMLDAPGIGLAAPQVHLPIRLIVFRAPDEAGDFSRVIRLVNPEIAVIGDTVARGWEGCLSIPELRGIVPRHAHISWRGITPEGETIEEEAQGHAARVVQHELDHLDGILYLDRMESTRLLTYPEHLSNFQQELL